MRRIIFAIDPGTGSSSACGICVYDPNTVKIITTLEVWPELQKPTWKRLRDMQTQVMHLLNAARDIHGPLEVRTESFVMRGKGGETLARFIGGVIAHLPWDSEFVEVHNIILKRNITGNARADKSEMGEALKKKVPLCIALIQEMIDNKSWDAIDAACIAICTETMSD